jgi:hypothetical protein
MQWEKYKKSYCVKFMQIHSNKFKLLAGVINNGDQSRAMGR